jgi:hypothetical protein
MTSLAAEFGEAGFVGFFALHNYNEPLANSCPDRPWLDDSWWCQNPMASRSSRTVPRPGSGSALRIRTRLRALGRP